MRPAAEGSAPGGKRSCEIAPMLMMYLKPSGTDMSSLMTFSSGTTIKNPPVGMGVVGMKMQTHFLFTFSLISSACSLVTKPTD